MGEILLSGERGRGMVAIVDDADLMVLSSRKWHLDGNGYAATGKQTLKMHRLLMDLEPGNRNEVDHINGNRLDNRRANLRVVTKSQNAQNRLPNRNGASPHRGVTLMPNGRWQARGQINGHRISLGCFGSEEEAVSRAVSWRREHMQFANG